MIALGARPFGALAAADAAQVLVVIGQPGAARVAPVVPKRAEVPHAYGIGVPRDGLEEVIAVERQIRGGFFHTFQTVWFSVFSIMARVPPSRTNSRRSLAGGT